MMLFVNNREPAFRLSQKTKVLVAHIPASVPAAATAEMKYRVLCLHGYRQNAAKMHVRIAGLRRAFKNKIEFVCIDGPLVVPYEPTTEKHLQSLEESPADQDDMDVKQFSWIQWEHGDHEGEHRYSKLDESLDFMKKVYAEQGPFDGIFGFSQGGTMASFLLQLQQMRPQEFPFNFKFAIFVAAACSRDPKVRFLQEDQRLAIPSLHIMGKTDAVVETSRSHALADKFENAKVFVHAGGHYIPTNKEPKDCMRQFMQEIDVLLGNA